MQFFTTQSNLTLQCSCPCTSNILKGNIEYCYQLVLIQLVVTHLKVNIKFAFFGTYLTSQGTNGTFYSACKHFKTCNLKKIHSQDPSATLFEILNKLLGLTACVPCRMTPDQEHWNVCCKIMINRKQHILSQDQKLHQLWKECGKRQAHWNSLKSSSKNLIS